MEARSRGGSRGSALGACEEASGHEGERGERREGVVLLAAGDGEEAEDDERPERKGEGGFALVNGHGEVMAEMSAQGDKGGGQEGRPGHDPDGGVEPEEPDWGLSVVVGNASAEEAGDVLIVEIEPGPASAGRQTETGGQGDGWVADRGKDVPGEGDDGEEGGRSDGVQAGKKIELAGQDEVEEDEGERGKTKPMRPLVRRLRARVAAKARQGSRLEG